MLSGGDPLTLSDRRLAELLADLEAIPHVRRVRVHTRLPVVLPERIDAGFLAMWNSPRRLQRVVVDSRESCAGTATAADVAGRTRRVADIRHDAAEPVRAAATA